MFAVIKNGGRQYKVSAGQKLEVNRMAVEIGKQVQLGEVLLISDADTTMVGSPLVENAMVLATAVAHTRGKKLIVFKYKSKKRYRHKRGHRQELTVFTIDDIVADGKSLLTGEAPRLKGQEEEQAPAVETPAAAEETSVVETAAEEPAATGEAAGTEAEAEAQPEIEKKTTRRRRTRKAAESEGEEEE